MQQRIQSKKYDSFRRKYSISESFRYNGNNIFFYCDGVIECGSNNYISENSTVQAYTGSRAVIGRNCMISHNVRIYTQSNIADWDFLNYPKPERVGNLIVEDYVWIGANFFINPGVTIGTNSIVAANSVVTKDILPFSVYGGVPLKFIRQKRLR